ncbi:hypothetical protein EI77_03820 [Prosthecobacter fusiformis]|uniref:Heavy-metal resistance protein n=1 Tax=Prosthecobacter fusiformis TaxID=48464 RepID=A0A4V3FE92_9BACT|nr:hypothetical protein [Prosthecobacter fusiformis]TDU66083.1 hypothetical protein EI77_03820 [Prosthecobacter fusiformis]
MRNSGHTLLVALLLGIAAFLITRGLQNHQQSRNFSRKVAAQEQDTRANLAWMRTSLSLTEEEFERECAIHDAHRAECIRLCAEMDIARERLKIALQNNDEHSAEGQAAIRDYEIHFETSERAAIQHVKKVAAAMNPTAGQKYLKMMLPHLFPEHDTLLPKTVPTPSPP